MSVYISPKSLSAIKELEDAFAIKIPTKMEIALAEDKTTWEGKTKDWCEWNLIKNSKDSYNCGIWKA